MTSITLEDIRATLQHLGLIRYINGSHVICVAPELVDAKWKRLVRVGLAFAWAHLSPTGAHTNSWRAGPLALPHAQNAKKGPIVDPTKLYWAPLRLMRKRDKWLIRAKLKDPHTEAS